LVPDDQSVEAVPARVVEAYDQMMRRVIGPALRQFGFTGTVREFKYGSRSRLGAAEIVTECAATDPRTLAALVDRLGRDPNLWVRKLIASRMLPLMTDHPDAISALKAAAGDVDTGVRWAARYALRIAAESSSN
jgi:hypothetical protein